MRSHDESLMARRLTAAGHTDHEIALATGIPRRTISGWRRGEGRTRDRAGCADRVTPHHDFSRLDSGAYAYVLGLYLGDGCISAGRRGVWCLRICLDATYPGIIGECAAGLEAIIPGKTAHCGLRRSSRCVDVSMWSKHWPCFFPQHGPGRKHLRPILLAPWQGRIVAASREAFVRGLIHSDGTRIVAMERKGSYVRRAPRYAFSNRSEDIRRLFCDSCDALGVRWTRPSDHQIAIYRKDSVARLDTFVGPKR
jgi:hypothetical protein